LLIEGGVLPHNARNFNTSGVCLDAVDATGLRLRRVLVRLGDAPAELVETARGFVPRYEGAGPVAQVLRHVSRSSCSRPTGSLAGAVGFNEGLEVRSVLYLPLIAHSRTLGAMTLAVGRGGRSYSQLADIPVVIVSGRGNLAKEAADMGARAWLDKPVRAERLFEAMRLLVS
jgi:hypothetical protein